MTIMIMVREKKLEKIERGVVGGDVTISNLLKGIFEVASSIMKAFINNL
jgi:hypothetical protein